ncbi:hypothetical protein R5R35_000505 [Gryllus longicercus]|uniref:Sugar transporter n=1 Tax=Gryllus longicercus TaxID=2509291 RepID=A0AAN9VIM4_9ORTH
MHCRLHLVGVLLLTSIGFLASSLSLEYSDHLIQLITTNEEYLTNNPILLSAELCSSIAIVLGCIGCCIPLQYLGRRSTLELLSAPLLILGCCMTFTFHHLLQQSQQNSLSNYIDIILFLGICLQGISCGFTFVAAPIYILETIGKVTNPSFSIGILLLATQMSTTTGLLLANVFPVTHETYFCHLIPAAFNVFSLIGFNFLPESPRWLLLKKNRFVDAKNALSMLKFSKKDDYESTAHLEHLKNENEKLKENRNITSYIHPLLLGIGLCSIWYLHGVHVYEFYASWTMKFAGISMKWKIDSTLLSLCIRFSAVSVLAAMYLIVKDINFHTTFLTFACAIVTLSLTVTGLCFYGFEEETTWVSYLCWLPLSTFLLFQCAFWLGLGSQVYILAVIISPQAFRPSIASVGGAMFWLGDMFSSRLVVPMISTLHPFGTFWFFAGMSAISLIFVLCSVFPEMHTKDLIPELPSHKISNTKALIVDEINCLYSISHKPTPPAN